MWPTAKIKQGSDVTIPAYNDVKDKSAKQSNKQKTKLSAEQVSLKAAIIVNK